MNNICTSIEQSKKLVELGIDAKTSDMFYGYIAPYEFSDRKFDGGYESYPLPKQYLYFDDEYVKNAELPAWSLSALLGLMPKFTFNGFGNGQFNCRDERADNYALVDTCPLDAAFEMVCWLKENNKI